MSRNVNEFNITYLFLHSLTSIMFTLFKMDNIIVIVVVIISVIILFATVGMMAYKWYTRKQMTHINGSSMNENDANKVIVDDNINNHNTNIFNISDDMSINTNTTNNIISTSSLSGGDILQPQNVPFPFTQVATLSNDVIATVPKNKFVWTEKTDGVRTVLLFENNNLWNVTFATKMCLIKSGLNNPHCVKRTIIDSEAYEDEYVIFDGIWVEGEDLSMKNYPDRFARAKQFLSSIRGVFKFSIAEYRAITTWDSLLEFIKNHHSPYTKRIIDGAIVQRADTPYFTKIGNPYVFKLKLPSMNTIDFVLKYVPDENLYYIYLRGDDVTFKTIYRKFPKNNKYITTHTGNDPKQPIPANSLILFASPYYNNISKFTPRIDWNTDGYMDTYITIASEIMKDMLADPMKYDSVIVELSFAADGWVPFRVRTDKLVPNSYMVGFENMSVLFDPINPNTLTYFAKSLSMDNKIVSDYHECSHIMRQYLFESVIGKWKNNRGINDDEMKSISGGRLEDIYGISDVHVDDSSVDNDDMNSGDISGSEIVTEVNRLRLNDDIDDINDVVINNDYYDPDNDPLTNTGIVSDHDVTTGTIHDTNNDNDNDTTFNGGEFTPKIYFHKSSNAISLLDLAAGRGADFFTFINLGVTNIFAVDQDRNALVKYARKRNGIAHMFKWSPLMKSTIRQPYDDTSLNIISYNLSATNEKLIELIQQRYEYPTAGFDIINMNFAIHYLCHSHKIMKSLADMISTLLNKNNGIFIVTYVDGDKVLSLMNGKGVLNVRPFTLTLKNYEQIDDESKKTYRVHDDDMQLIEMPLPTIDSTGYRVEPLVTSKYLDDIDECLEMADEFYICDAAKDYFHGKFDVLNYLSLFKARVYRCRQ